MAAPRVYYAMARDGLFSPAVATIHPRFGTPARAIALQATLASVLVALGTFDQIVGYFIFATVLFIALTVVAVFTLRRSKPDAASARIPLYPLPPIVFLALVALLTVLLVVGRPKQSLLGVAVVALGLPVYGVVFRKRSQAP
jgi:APA family basic amino acid/polyamine antiporter